MGGGCSQGYWPCAEPGQAGGRCSARSLVALASLGEQGSALAATAMVHSL